MLGRLSPGSSVLTSLTSYTNEKLSAQRETGGTGRRTPPPFLRGEVDLSSGLSPASMTIVPLPNHYLSCWVTNHGSSLQAAPKQVDHSLYSAYVPGTVHTWAHASLGSASCECDFSSRWVSLCHMTCVVSPFGGHILRIPPAFVSLHGMILLP